MGHSPQMLLGPGETEGWRLGSPLEPALLPGSRVLAPEEEGGREGELLRTLQITHALNRRCSPPSSQGKSTCQPCHLRGKQPSWLVRPGG